MTELYTGNIVTDIGGASALCREITAVMPAELRSVAWLAAGLSGSHAHGLATSASDVDLWVIGARPLSDYARLLDSGRGVAAWHSAASLQIEGRRLDVTYYDARKWFSMLAAQNPTAHSWLWGPSFYCGPGWPSVVTRRAEWLSVEMLRPLLGCANGQLLAPGASGKKLAEGLRVLMLARQLAAQGTLFPVLDMERALLRAVREEDVGEGASLPAFVEILARRLEAEMRECLQDRPILPASVPVAAFEAAWWRVAELVGRAHL